MAGKQIEKEEERVVGTVVEPVETEALETQTPTSKGQTEQKKQRGQRETERGRNRFCPYVQFFYPLRTLSLSKCRSGSKTKI